MIAQIHVCCQSYKEGEDGRGIMIGQSNTFAVWTVHQMLTTKG